MQWQWVFNGESSGGLPGDPSSRMVRVLAVSAFGTNCRTLFRRTEPFTFLGIAKNKGFLWLPYVSFGRALDLARTTGCLLLIPLVDLEKGQIHLAFAHGGGMSTAHRVEVEVSPNFLGWCGSAL